MTKAIKKNGHAMEIETKAGEKKDLNVGEKLSLSDTPDAETIQTSQQALWNLHQVLGEKYVAFKRDEMALLQAIEKAEMNHSAVVLTVAKKNGIDTDSKDKKYQFNPQAFEFTRTI